MSSANLPSSIPIFTTLEGLREWRGEARKDEKSVGFVPTMGALHEGHLSLVKASLAQNDLTILSIFVNPTQFAPHEDLTSYPRTLESDLLKLSQLSVTSKPGKPARTPSAIFLPTVGVMYPSKGSAAQDQNARRGTVVEVKGFGDKMEGLSRPSFFCGVATVVTKLFNAVEPTHAYFGQKDIQQALLLRRLTADLLLSHPSPQTLHIIPTSRDPTDGLALSSRNAYLTPTERPFAGALYAALTAGRTAWAEGQPKLDVCGRALSVLESARTEALQQGVSIRVDYIEVNDSDTFDVVDDGRTKNSPASSLPILSGAMWVGKTRLIDNVILGDASKILY